jgi:hypothetical protein
MPNPGMSTTRTPLARATAWATAALASAWGSSRWKRRAPMVALPAAPSPRPATTAVSMAYRAMSSWALAVSASASAANSVDSALASSPRTRLNARSSGSGGGCGADEPDGGGISCSIGGRLRSTPTTRSTSRQAGGGAIPSARHQSVTEPAGTSSRSSCARQAGGTPADTPAITADTSRPARWVARRRTTWTTSAGCHPLRHSRWSRSDTTR